MPQHGKQTLRLACDALATLVRQEAPVGMPLAEIAEIWGEGVTNEQIAALRQLEGQGPKRASASATKCSR